MIIDAHAHACGELGSLEGIIFYLKRNALDRIVLCPGEHNSKKNYPVPMIANVFPTAKIGYGFNRVIRRVVKLSGVADTLHEQNMAIAEMAKAKPSQILQAYWINPLEDTALRQMDVFYKSNPFCMVKLHQCWHSFGLQHKNIDDIFDWARKYRLPVFIHLVSAEQCRIFCACANKHKDCVFIVGHMIGFEIIAPNLKHDNVYFDISAPFMIPFHLLQKAVELWNGGRLILGSDAPYGNRNIYKNKQRIERLRISDSAKAKILGGNIMSLLSSRCQH